MSDTNNKIFEGEFIVIYNDKKVIKNIFITDTTYLPYQQDVKGQVTNTYDELVDFIYDEGLYFGKYEKYDWTRNISIKSDFLETIIKTDD